MVADEVDAAELGVPTLMTVSVWVFSVSGPGLSLPRSCVSGIEIVLELAGMLCKTSSPATGD